VITEIDQKPSVAHRQIIANAEARLLTLATEQQEYQMRLPVLQSERATIQAKAAARATQLAQARHNAAEARTAYEGAKVHTQLAQGTTASATSHASLEAQGSQVTRLEAERDALVVREANEAPAEARRLAELKQHELECSGRLVEISIETQNTETAKRIAWQDLGKAENEEVQVQLTAADDAISELEKQLEAARAARLEVIHAGVERLVDWSEYQPELLGHLPLDDATTRIVEAEIGYIDALLADGRQMPARIQGLPALYETNYSIDPLLELPGGFFHTIESFRGNPTQLKRRRYVLSNVLTQYKAKKHGEGKR
jgi:hypothetical protein